MKTTLPVTGLVALAVQASAQLGPQIITQPTNQVVPLGGTAVFSVQISGPGPFHYEWRLNGMDRLSGTITTVAGNGLAGFSGDGGAATDASFKFPVAVTLDPVGNLYIADAVNNRVRKVGTNGIVTTVAGKGPSDIFVGVYSGDGGQATNAGLTWPNGVALDNQGNLFIADWLDSRVRKVATNGVITTYAGDGKGGDVGEVDDGPATGAPLGNNPALLAVDRFGNLFIPTFLRIREVDTNGIIWTVAGGTNGTYSGDGGPATNAGLGSFNGVAVDDFGNLFIADTSLQRIRKVGPDGIITTVAGNGTAGYSGDGGPATEAQFHDPTGVAVDAAGNLFIADLQNSCVRKVGTNGIITTVAGNGVEGFGGDGGAALNAKLDFPNCVALDADGDLFIADANNNRIRKVTPSGPSLALVGVTPRNTGNYDVVITSPSGSVTSQVAVLTVTLPRLQASIESSNRLILQLSGTPGQTYILQAASNLVSSTAWEPVFTNAADAHGHWGFTNAFLPQQRAMFYGVTVP